MSEINLREATPADLPTVAELWQRLDQYHRGLGLAFPEAEGAAEKWLNSFQRTLGRFSFVWLADDGSGPQAFLLARVKQSPAFLGAMQVGEISDIYVDDALRGSGVGARLVEQAMQKFSELSVHSVEVQILAGNDPGLDFWLKQGFRTDLTLVRKVLKAE